MKLLWIDCEMTGLNYEKDEILEIAYILTDSDFNFISEGNWVIHHTDETLDKMDDWCKYMHGKSDLISKAKESTFTYEFVEAQIMNMLNENTLRQEVFITGNSVYNDFVFIKKIFPRIAHWIHYRIVDVSSFKIILTEWYRGKTYFKKNKQHRALEDIKESINELKFYKKNFFI